MVYLQQIRDIFCMGRSPQAIYVRVFLRISRFMQVLLDKYNLMLEDMWRHQQVCLFTLITDVHM